MMRIVFSLALVSLLAACADNPNASKQTVGNTPFGYQIERYGTRYHLYNDSLKPYCDINLAFTRLTGGYAPGTLAYLHQSFYEQFFSPTNGGVTLEERFRIEAELILAEYRALERELAGKDSLVQQADLTWNFEHRLDVIDQNAKRLGFRVSRFQFAGGANPRIVNQFVNIDLDKQQIIRLDQLVAPSKQDALRQRILAKIRSQFDTQADFELHIWSESLQASNNFLLTDSSITFYYNPREIGPYSLGPVEVLFGLAELEDIMR